MAETLVELIQEGKDITEHLLDSQKERLEVCEIIIHKGLHTFLEVGQALAEIRDDRLYRETHLTFEKYCKEVWDLSKGYANQQIGGYQTVSLLESKMAAIAAISKTSSEETPDQEKKCTDCGFREALANKTKGVKIPGEPGKCTRPEGLCEKHSQPVDSPDRQKIILPINEAQTRPLTKLSPDDQVKAWMLVLEKLNQDPKAKLTSGFINKTVKEIKGEVVREKIKQTKSDVDNTSLVNNMFKKQFQVMLDIVSEERNNGWKTIKRAEAAKHIKALLKIVENDD
jgi:hypothetical protein